MRGILIDPVEQTITEIEIEPGLRAMYDALQCTCIDIRGLADKPWNADLICDDEGRLVEGQRCFEIIAQGGGMLLIAGRALILGSDREGNTCSTNLPMFCAERVIRFLPEGYDYTPPEPLVIGFSSPEMLKFLCPQS